MDLRTGGMELASEIVIKAAAAGLRISEIPITLHRDGRGRPRICARSATAGATCATC